MSFRLRGGRPKNMGQGIYWVQRNLADQKAAARSQAPIARANASAAAFNERYSRVVANMKSYFGSVGEISVGQSHRDRINKANEAYAALHGAIESNIAGATNGDLSKLATAAKNLITAFAKANGQTVEWDRTTATLRVGTSSFRF